MGSLQYIVYVLPPVILIKGLFSRISRFPIFSVNSNYISLISHNEPTKTWARTTICRTCAGACIIAAVVIATVSLCTHNWFHGWTLPTAPETSTAAPAPDRDITATLHASESIVTSAWCEEGAVASHGDGRLCCSKERSCCTGGSHSG